MKVIDRPPSLTETCYLKVLNLSLHVVNVIISMYERRFVPALRLMVGLITSNAEVSLHVSGLVRSRCWFNWRLSLMRTT